METAISTSFSAACWGDRNCYRKYCPSGRLPTAGALHERAVVERMVPEDHIHYRRYRHQLILWHAVVITATLAYRSQRCLRRVDMSDIHAWRARRAFVENVAQGESGASPGPLYV